MPDLTDKFIKKDPQGMFMLWFNFSLGTFWYLLLFWCMIILYNEKLTLNLNTSRVDIEAFVYNSHLPGTKNKPGEYIFLQ